MNYVNKLQNEPNLILVNYSSISRQHPDCWSCLFALASLGIVPRVINKKNEIEFTFRFPEYLAYPRGGRGNYDDRSFFHSFYNQLYEKREELIQLSKR